MEMELQIEPDRSSVKKTNDDQPGSKNEDQTDTVDYLCGYGAFLKQQPPLTWTKNIQDDWIMLEKRQIGMIGTFSDPTDVSPLVFLHFLNNSYLHGKFNDRAATPPLQQQVCEALCNMSRTNCALYVARCLHIMTVLEACSEDQLLGFEAVSRFLVRVVGRLAKHKGSTTHVELQEAKQIASKLIIDSIVGTQFQSKKILLDFLKVFDITIKDIKDVLQQSDGIFEEIFQSFSNKLISKLLSSPPYLPAVTILEHLSVRQGETDFLLPMMDKEEYEAAEKWATYNGKEMLRHLVSGYLERKMDDKAFRLIQKNDLCNEVQYAEVYRDGIKRSIKSFADKALWFKAEQKAGSDTKLLQYVVHLAAEKNNGDLVAELCKRHPLTVPEASVTPGKYLSLGDLNFGKKWVDDTIALQDAKCHIVGCKVIAIDCEWRPNFEKGSKNGMVSIMQIATEKEEVFVIDLIKLFSTAPDHLNSCLKEILHSCEIMKLGYDFHNDMKELVQSYGNFNCFERVEKLLDLKSVFKRHQGGLLELTQEKLDKQLNKTMRLSDWELRPLSPLQLEYAALDAAVLIRIWDGIAQSEWESHIVSYPPKIKKKVKNVKSCNAGTKEAH